MANYLSSNLILLRKFEKLSQEEAATALGLKRTTYRNYESGDNEPDLVTLVNLSAKFNVSLDDLINTDLSKGKDSIKLNTKEKGGDVGKDLGGVSEGKTPYGEDKRGSDPGQIDYRDELIVLLKQVLESTRSELAEHKKSTLQILTNLGRMEADQQILLKNIMVVSEFLALQFGRVLKSPEAAIKADLSKIVEHVETLAQKDK